MLASWKFPLNSNQFPCLCYRSTLYSRISLPPCFIKRFPVSTLPSTSHHRGLPQQLLMGFISLTRWPPCRVKSLWTVNFIIWTLYRHLEPFFVFVLPSSKGSFHPPSMHSLLVSVFGMLVEVVCFGFWLFEYFVSLCFHFWLSPCICFSCC